MRILLVDDDSLILSLVGETLRHAGYADLTEAGSAEEAVSIVATATEPFDCFLVDLRMPGADGDILCRWLRRLDLYKTTPIVMITAARHEDEISLAFEAGASDYLNKPLDLTEIVEKIRKIDRATLSRGRSGADGAGQDDGAMRFEAARMVGGVPNEIDLGSMENYLLRISDTDAVDIELFAVALRDAARLHFTCSTSEYTDLLRQTGHAAAKQIGPNDYFVSYAGNGTFVCVSRRHDRANLNWKGVESAIQRQLAPLAVPSESGDSMGLVVLMTEPQGIVAHQGRQAVDTMHRAILEAELRRDLPAA